MAIYAIYIGNICNINDFVLGTPILNRSNYAEKNTCGMFISTVPFYFHLDNNASFVEFAQQIAMDTLSMLRHQKYPYQNILEDIRQKNPSQPNLYDILISYQNSKADKNSTNIPYDIRWTFNNNLPDSLQIHLFDINDDGNLNIAYDYKLSKYTEKDICEIHLRINHIINQVLSQDSLAIHDIEIVTPDEKNLLLNKFNATYLDYNKSRTVVDYFEDQVEKTPDAIALVFQKQMLTYKQLNEKINSLARFLKQHNIGANSVVGVMLNRSFEMMVSLLAVLKAGGAYIPIDPEYPEERISYMLSQSKSAILISQKHLEDKITKINFSGEIIYSDFSNTEIYSLDNTNLNTVINPIDLSYLIYTSGSTGMPKGVMLNHKNLSNFISSMFKKIAYLNDNKPHSIVSITTVSFDIFAFETIVSLCRGLKLFITTEAEQKITANLERLILENKIEIIQSTPSIMNFHIENSSMNAFTNLHYIMLAGEQLPKQLVDKIKHLSPDCTIYNGYGPSETTIFSTVKDVTNLDSITIGEPINNTQIYILNNNLSLLPPGTIGEMYISGDGVGNGYLYREDLTKERYLNNPYAQNSIMYKTGDLGLWLPNGSIECKGRADHQVKLRGLRIELGEIEQQILNDPNISNCCAAIKTLNDNRDALCAYYTKIGPVLVENLRKSLQAHLPNYMVPQYFVELDALPHTPNGKIDRKLLPMPDTKNKAKEITLPRNNTDKIIINLLENILNIEDISIDDSFFDLGGDSLSAINLCTKIYSEFNVQILVKDILENSIIKDLSDFVSNKSSIETQNSIPVANKSDYYPVSSAQKRTYYASSISGTDSTLYNIAGGLILDSFPNFEKLENAFKKLVQRHPALRTYFDIVDGQVVQKIMDEVNFQLNLAPERISDNDIPSTFNNFVKPFNLSVAPLFRAELVKLNDNQAFLMIDMHHIISDGTSLSILVNDLCKIYNDDELPALKIDYKDYAVYENTKLKNGDFNDAENYWINQFKEEIPVLNLPTKPRPAIQSYEGNKVYSQIDELHTKKINELAKNLGVTPYMILLSVYYILLSRYSSSEDIVIGTPIVNRNSSELYDIVGMFVNSLPIRLNFESKISFKELVNSVKEICLQSYKYQSYPFDELVNKLNIPRDTSRNPLFDTMFIYQNNGYTPALFDEIHAKYYIPNSNISKFDLSLEIVPDEDILNLSFEYAVKLFDEGFIKNLSNHYINIIDEILDNCDMKISDISMLSETEKNKLLYEFNNTAVDYPKNKTISQLFEDQVEKTPNNIAVVFGDKSLTYKELNEKANSIAHYLRNNNIGRNDIVGIMVNRSLEMIISILGVLKSGGAYLPIDPTYPKSRITYMIEDSKIKMILTQSNIQERFNDLSETLLVPIDTPEIYSNPNTNLKTINTPEDLAYLIYTSGSTGKPKGVMLTQKNVNNFIEATFNRINFKDTIVSVTTMCFDIFVLESLLPLTKGLKVVIANETEQNIPKSLNELCIKNNVKMLQTTPARMSLLLSDSNNLDYIKNLSVIMLGGEPFPYKLLQELKSITNAEIYNMYGPTETTVWSSIKDLSKFNAINIGTPIANTQMYILDKSQNLLPIGVPGELYIGGDGLSKGYLGKDKLTSEKFIINKYINNDIIYNTGDIAKWLPNGELDCLGRSDSQIKLRGLRIELGEIEKQILSFPNIDNSSVCIKKDSSDRQFLCAYFVSKERISTSELKNYLSKFLPNYMIPAFLIQLENFKYTPNGKVDKNALPMPNISTTNNIIPPETEIEKQLLKIWEDLLSVSPISIDENFFNIGGDSILALKMQIELLNNNINISYADIFKYNTIKGLALKIESINSNDSVEEFYKDYDFSKLNELLKNNNLSNANQIQQNKIGNVLLTGATGFLGAHILDYLLSNTNSNVYCIIRKDSNNATSTTDKLMNKLHYYFDNKYDDVLDKRLFVVTSDITIDNLGLTDTQLDELSNNVSCVINSAAIVKHYGYYSEFEKINVNGVKNLIDFCKKYNKKLVQISTISVSGNTLTDLGIQENSFDKNIDFTESNLYIKQSLNNVYVRSKFEAEKVILENIINNSLDAIILRVGNITSRLSDGKFQPNSSENAFLNRLKAFVELRVLPDYVLDDYVEFSPVDELSRAIVESIEHVSSAITVLHLYNQNHVYIRDLIKMLPENLISIVSDEEFKNILNKNLQTSANKDIISHITNDLNKDKKLIYSSKIKIKNTISAQFLETIKFEWGLIDKNYINNLLNIL